MSQTAGCFGSLDWTKAFWANLTSTKLRAVKVPYSLTGPRIYMQEGRLMSVVAQKCPTIELTYNPL